MCFARGDGTTFTAWASKSLSDEVKQSVWRDIPVTRTQTTQCMTVLPDYREKIQELTRAAGTSCTKAVIETGHRHNVTATENIAARAVI